MMLVLHSPTRSLTSLSYTSASKHDEMNISEFVADVLCAIRLDQRTRIVSSESVMKHAYEASTAQPSKASCNMDNSALQEKQRHYHNMDKARRGPMLEDLQRLGL